MFGVFGWNMLDEANRGLGSTQAGREVLEPMSLLSFFFAISIGVIATSDSVSEEKREGTLGLLFLTDLKGYDVILGKLAAHSISAFYALVAIMPLLGMPLLMGGVTMAQFVKLVIALVTAMVLSLSTGIFISTHSRNERKAMVFTILMIAAITCGPWLVAFWWFDRPSASGLQHWLWRALMFSPGFAVALSVDTPSFFPARAYWYGISLSLSYALAMLWAASKKAPHSWTEEASPKTERPRPGPKLTPRARKLNKGWLDDNPFLWLAMRGEASRGRVWLFVVAVFVIWLFGFFKAGSVMWSGPAITGLIIVLHGCLKIWVAGEASRRFVEDRRNNAMEFLLSTPLNETAIIRGQWRALWVQFSGPVLFVLVWETVMALGMPARDNSWLRMDDHNTTMARLIIGMVFLPLDFFALGWAGMWLGMKAKNRSRAMLGAVALVVVAPWLMTRLFFAGLDMLSGNSRPDSSLAEACALGLAGFGTDAVVFTLAAQHLIPSFRQLALAGYSRQN